MMLLDRFTRQFFETLLWSETACLNDDGEPDENDDRSFSDHGFTVEDIEAGDPKGFAELVEECRRFQEENAADIARRDDEHAGHDFCLTRNETGAGFWDGDWPEEVGERLTEASDKYGPVSLYVGDDGATVYVEK